MKWKSGWDMHMVVGRFSVFMGCIPPNQSKTNQNSNGWHQNTILSNSGTKTQFNHSMGPNPIGPIQCAMSQSNARSSTWSFHFMPLLRSLTVSIRKSTLSASDVSKFHTGVFGSTTSSFIIRHSGSCTNGQFWMSVISVCTRSWQIGWYRWVLPWWSCTYRSTTTRITSNEESTNDCSFSAVWSSDSRRK